MVNCPSAPSKRRRIASAAAALILLLATGCDRGSHPEQIGTRAPVFALNDGEHAVNLSSLRGQVVVLNFWASWCAPCIEELPSLEQMQRDLPGIHIIAVSTDEDGAAYERFLKQHSVSLLTVRDDAQRSNAMYGTFRFPETYVIDKKGFIRRKFIGAQDWTSPEIEGYLKKLAS
ncbi:MAG TPA: TlpA disulfide reductase family protein [Acidobacteriaceae bacterium]|jgi:thiol-disulfide isomerase/thioredoxin